MIARLLILTFLLGAPSSRAGEAATATSTFDIANDARRSRHLDLEELYSKGEAAQGLRVARARLAEHPDDPELYLHAARFIFELAEQSPNLSDAQREKRYTEMKRLLNKGLKLAPGHPRFLFGIAIARARLATTRGVLRSLSGAKDVEGLLLKVANANYRYQSLHDEEVLPCDAQVALGILYRLLPDWWGISLVAGTRGDLQKSLALLKKSDRCAGGRHHVIKELGVTELCLGQTDGDEKLIAAGKRDLKRVIALPADRRVERIDVAHAKRLLKDPSLACGYSRDKQQERSKEALEKSR